MFFMQILYATGIRHRLNISGHGAYDAQKQWPGSAADEQFRTKDATPRGRQTRWQAQAAPRKPRKAAARRKKTGKRRNPVVALVLGLLRLVWRVIWAFAWRIGLVTALIVGLATGYVFSTLPPVSDLNDGRANGSVTMLDRDGAVFAWRGDQFGGVVTADTVSPHLKNAVVATEDKRFFGHPGIDPIGIAGAIRINLREGRGPLSGNGGSTITQQTAKLLCLGVEYDPAEWESQAAYEADCRQSTLWRKAKEAIFALAMEAKYSKDDILTVYLNRAYMGGGAYGAEAAAQRFFGKSAARLTPAEGAMLAGLLTAPTTLAPTNNLERSRNRASVVIGLMHEQGYLSDNAAQRALDNPATLSQAAEKRAGGYFADWVMSAGPDFFTRNSSDDVIIRTTLDQRIQTAAEQGLTKVFDDKVRDGSKAQAAVVVMSADGAVRAMVGGRDTRAIGAFNRATQALRQTGSAFKPFVYAAALELGYSPLDTVEDEPITIDVPGSGRGHPRTTTASFTAPSPWPRRCAPRSTCRRSRWRRASGWTACAASPPISASTRTWPWGRRWRWGRRNRRCWR